MSLKNFSLQKLALKDDYEGKVIATLIASNDNIGNRKSVLYIHGFIDHFFHAHLAEEFLEKGYDFYALELRKYAHSLLPHQHPCYCKKLEEYFEEIDLALEIITAQSKNQVVLMGHSQGGLLSALYMNKGRNRNMVEKLILNSPFLEFNVHPRIKQLAGKWISGPLSMILPFSSINDAITPLYPMSLHKDFEGEWNFDLKFKPIKSFPAYYAWLHAVSKAQKEIRASSYIIVPTLVLYASHSIIPTHQTESLKSADIILNVKHIQQIAPYIGNRICLKQINNAVHDVFLSSKEVRTKAFEEMFLWLEHYE